MSETADERLNGFDRELAEWRDWRRHIDARLAALDTAISLAKWAIPVSITITAVILSVVLR